jgi:hypothetical protein
MVTIRSGYRVSDFLVNVLFRGGFDDFTALILAAFGADTVRQFGLVAVRALGEGGLAQSVVSATVLSARVGVSSFWIRHCFLLSSLLLRA